MNKLLSMSRPFLAVGALLLVAPSAFATGDLLDDARLDAVAEKIDLDDATRDRIREIAEETLEENAPRRAAIRRARLQMRLFLEADEPDEAAVMAQVDELTDLQRELWKTRLKNMIEIRALLTPVQRERLTQLRQQQFGQTDRACREDARALCPMAIDLRAVVVCLIENKDQLSEGCRAKLAQGRLSRHFESDEAP